VDQKPSRSAFFFVYVAGIALVAATVVLLVDRDFLLAAILALLACICSLQLARWSKRGWFR
jgi:hypothetical protein